MSAHPIDWTAMRRGLTGCTPEVRARAVNMLAGLRDLRDEARRLVAEWEARVSEAEALKASVDESLAAFRIAAAEAEGRHDKLAAILDDTAGEVTA